MNYLHQCEIGVHGHLKSKNCLVDIRFCLKIGDYGLPSLRNAKKHWDHPVDAQSLLWTAPEILRKLVGENDKRSQFCGTQKSDVYSFGIILHEIIFRKGPFYLEDENGQIRQLEFSHILAQVAQVMSWQHSQQHGEN
jgi:serine/threonine protein kinase